MRKRALFGIVILALLFIPLSYQIDASIFNNVQRAGAAFELRDFLVHDLWHIHSFSDIVETFVGYYHHYTFVSGFIEWPPLQLILLTISSILFGKTYFSIFFVDFIFNFLLLFYSFKLTEKYYKGREWWVILSIITTPFILQQFLSNFLEIGMMALTLMFAYYFLEYLKENDAKYLYISSAIFGLGMLYKLQFILAIVPAGILYLKHIWRTKKISFRALGIAIGIFIVIMVPYIAQQAILYKLGISNIDERTIGRFDSFNSVKDYVWLSPNDYAFRKGISKTEENILNNKLYYHTPILSKLYTVFTSTFYNLILFIVLILLVPKLRKLWETDIFFLLYFITTFAFFTILGTLPRYLIGATISLYFLIPKIKNYRTIFAILIIGNIILSLFFFHNIYNNKNLISRQYAYDNVNTAVNGTVITSMLKRQSLTFLMNSSNAYLIGPPTKKSIMDYLLAKPLFNYTSKRFLSEYGNLEYPRIKEVIIHSGKETGIVPGLYDYNIKKYMDSRPDFVKTTIIKGNSKIFIYKR